MKKCNKDNCTGMVICINKFTPYCLYYEDQEPMNKTKKSDTKVSGTENEE